MSDAQLVYSTSIFKSLATGGNVSQALVSLSLLDEFLSLVEHLCLIGESHLLASVSLVSEAH